MGKEHHCCTPPPPAYSACHSTTVLTPPSPTIYIQQSPSPTVVVNQQPVVLGREPVAVSCPACHHRVISKTKAVGGTACCLTGLSSVLLSPTGIGLFLCCVICCTDAVHDIEHKCPNCHYPLGVSKRI